MTLTINLTPHEEARLSAAAQQTGLEPSALVKQIMSDHLPEPPIQTSGVTEDPALALFAQWEKEDAERTPEQVAADDRLWEQFETNINAERDRAGARRVF